MRTLDEISTHELKEHLIKNWMTHDGAWFHHCLRSYGIEVANRVNKDAIKILAPIELKRAQKLFALKDIDTLHEVRDVIHALFSVSKGDFMKFSFSFPREDLLTWEWHDSSCFAYQGMCSMGAVAGYQCGVIYRVLCWLDCLGVDCTVEPGIEGCLMHTHGRCGGEIRLALRKQSGRG